MKLVASMIVRNELGRYLEPCIHSLQEFCDQIDIVDDASTDGTFEWLAGQKKVNIVQLPSSEGFFNGHEGRRRQFLLEWTLKSKPTWVLAVDADEFIGNGEQLRHFCEKDVPLGTLIIEEVWSYNDHELHVRIDGGWHPHAIPILWRVPDVLDETWRIQDRALACGREPQAVRNFFREARPTGTDIFHFGWSREDERPIRYQRYVEADGGRFHNRRHLDSIMWPPKKVRLKSRPWPKGLRPLEDGMIGFREHPDLV